MQTSLVKNSKNVNQILEDLKKIVVEFIQKKIPFDNIQNYIKENRVVLQNFRKFYLRNI